MTRGQPRTPLRKIGPLSQWMAAGTPPNGKPFFSGLGDMALNRKRSPASVFRGVMEHLGVVVLTHLPAGSDGRRTTARSKAKVERTFRTVKEAHETRYHFHKPQNEAETNLWFRHYLASYNAQRHRPSRIRV